MGNQEHEIDSIKQRQNEQLDQDEKYNQQQKSNKQQKSKFYIETDDELKVDGTWVVWRKVNKNNDLRFQAETAVRDRTYGYWKILDVETRTTIPITHLNTIFELVHSDQIGNIGGKKKFQINIFLTDDKKQHHYQLIWWNGKKRAECNTFVLKKMTENQGTGKKEGKDRYYMLCDFSKLNSYIGKSKTKQKTGVVWKWYNNIKSSYDTQTDFQDDERKGLVHKQMEATYLSNLNENFPWEFDETDDGTEKHSFNCAQLTVLYIFTNKYCYILQFLQI